MEAALNGFRVLFIDTDPQQTLTNWFEKWEGGLENLTFLKKITSAQIDKLIRNLKESNEYDVCIIDTPGYDTEEVSVSIDSCDFVLIPCKPIGVDMEAASKTIAYAQSNKKATLFLMSQVIPKTSFEDFMPILCSFSKRGVLIPGYFSMNNDYAVALSTGKTIHDFNRKQEKEELKLIWSFISEFCEIKKEEDKLPTKKSLNLLDDYESQETKGLLDRKRGRPRKPKKG